MSGDLWVILPLACLAGGAFAVYILARTLNAANVLLALFTAVVFATSLATAGPLFVEAGKASLAGGELPRWGYLQADGAVLRADPGAMVIIVIALGLGMLVTVYSGRYLALDHRYEAYYPLLLLLVIGLCGMVLAADLFNLYMFCELMSVAAYALVSFRRHTDTAIEAGFKYLIMGSLATVIILMGISFVYRETGHLDLLRMAEVSSGAASVSRGPWLRAGLACFLVGLGIKSAIVPLHTWLPDAHGRAPSSISAMLSGIVVQSAFYVLLKVSLALGLPARGLGSLLIALALLNMTLGNVLALVQTNTKRLLGYSTIAQMGYVMLGVGIGLRSALPLAIQAGFFMLLAHAAMKGLAFLSKGVFHFYCDTTTIAQLRGTSRQLPLVAVTLSVALGGLAGVPPLAGFAGKWLVLTRAMSKPDVLTYVGVCTLLLNSLLALGYYLPLIGTLFAPSTFPSTMVRKERRGGEVSVWMAVPLVILGGLVIALGLYPGPWLDSLAHVGAYLLSLGG